MDFEQLFKQEQFKKIDKQVLDSFVKLSQNIKGKSTNEAILHIMNFYKTMPKDTNLSKEETEALMQAILLNLSEKERNNFYKMLDLIGNFM